MASCTYSNSRRSWREHLRGRLFWLSDAASSPCPLSARQRQWLEGRQWFMTRWLRWGSAAPCGQGAGKWGRNRNEVILWCSRCMQRRTRLCSPQTPTEKGSRKKEGETFRRRKEKRCSADSCGYLWWPQCTRAQERRPDTSQTGPPCSWCWGSGPRCPGWELLPTAWGSGSPRNYPSLLPQW